MLQSRLQGGKNKQEDRLCDPGPQDVGAASEELSVRVCVCERTITSGDLLYFKDSEGGEAQPEKSPLHLHRG